MDILVVGGGGREHALVRKIGQSKRCGRLFCAPGNGGIAQIAQCVDIAATDLEGMTRFARENGIDLVVVSPDDPLALGMVDALEASGIRAFGPRKNAAVIEGSKVFAKGLMKRRGIPTAAYEVFTEANAALEYIESARIPIVVKADGLALGKGVMVCQTREEAKATVDNIMVKKAFGDAGSKIVIEEFLTGPEVSALAFTDGRTVLPMISAQDHKRAYDGDMGPNTGGMGAFAPSPKYTKDIADYVYEKIMLPTVTAMAEEGRPFAGVLYFGLMLTADGPKVLEYNARFGDPETQAILPLLKNDILDVFDAVIDGRLHEITLEWENAAAACVVMASGGYPGSYRKGLPIYGIGDAEALPGVSVFHAGTKLENGRIVTSGGRVLGVTALGENVSDAAKNAYEAVAKISFEGAFYRKDIGKK